MTHRPLLVSFAACALSLASRVAPAQKPIFAADFDGVSVEITAKHGLVQMASRWTKAGEPVLFLAHDTITTSAGPRYGIRPPAELIRVFMSPDTASRLVHDAERELAVPDSIRFPREGFTWAFVTLGQPHIAGFESHRAQMGRDKPAQYEFYTWSCRGQRMTTYTARENWVGLVNGLRRAIDTAARQRREARATDRVRATVPRAVDEIACPARPFSDNGAIALDSAADFLGAPRRATVQFVVDSAGRVIARSMKTIEGDSVLSRAAEQSVRSWQFMPALDSDRRRIAQTARLLVLDRAPVSSADSDRVFDAARHEGAQFVSVAVPISRGPHDRWITATDGSRLIHELTIGRHSLVVFIHDLGGRAAYWTDVMRSLEPMAGSLAYDLRGHGGSTRSRDADYSLDAQVSDLSTVIDSTMVAFPIVVAMGSSCAIAAEFARRYPNRVSSLVLIAPVTRDNTHGTTARVARASWSINGRSFLGFDGGRAFADFAVASDRTPRTIALLNDLRATPPDVIAETLESLRDYDVARVVSEFRGSTDILIATQRSGPVLMVPGTFPDFSSTFAANVDTSRMHITDGKGIGMSAALLDPAALTSWLQTVIPNFEHGQGPPSP